MILKSHGDFSEGLRSEEYIEMYKTLFPSGDGGV